MDKIGLLEGFWNPKNPKSVRKLALTLLVRQGMKEYTWKRYSIKNKINLEKWK